MENGNPVMTKPYNDVLITRLEIEQKFCFKTWGFDIINVLE